MADAKKAAQEAPAVEKPPEKTAEQIESEGLAAKAKAGLKLFCITSDRKISMPPPHGMFEIVEGANHFEDLPEAVLTRLAALQKAGTISVVTLDGDGKPSPWPTPQPAADR
jgi:hypothetical protein